MAVSGEAVRLYFEEKLQEIFPGQSFPELTEPEESVDMKDKQEDETDDSDDDFVQPRRKRLKAEDKIVHIKWKQASSETREVNNCLPRIDHFSCGWGNRQKGRDSL